MIVWQIDRCKKRTVVPVLCTIAIFFFGCGGSPEVKRSTDPTIDYGGGKLVRARRGGMQVDGIMGTINTNRIQEIFELKLLKFERCFADRESEIESIGGHIEFYFRVALDGSVVWVNPKSSTVGDRKTERCLMDIVKTIHFPEPRGGGEAEVAWGFERESNPDIPPLVDTDEESVIPIVNENADSLLACNVGTSGITVNAYVAPGGTVIAAGVSISGRDEADQSILDCITDTVVGWVMPDPGSRAAKVHFDLPLKSEKSPLESRPLSLSEGVGLSEW